MPAAKAGLIETFNDGLAVRITALVSTIWAFYAFVLFGCCGQARRRRSCIGRTFCS
jgi:hypothetical protein